MMIAPVTLWGCEIAFYLEQNFLIVFGNENWDIVKPFSCSKSHKLGICGVGGGCAWAGKRTLDLAWVVDVQTEMVERRTLGRSSFKIIEPKPKANSLAPQCSGKSLILGPTERASQGSFQCWRSLPLTQR
jgi:hypothetical protein